MPPQLHSEFDFPQQKHAVRKRLNLPGPLFSLKERILERILYTPPIIQRKNLNNSMGL